MNVTFEARAHYNIVILNYDLRTIFINAIQAQLLLIVADYKPITDVKRQICTVHSIYRVFHKKTAL